MILRRAGDAGPWFATYSATKAYLLSLSLALHEELERLSGAILQARLQRKDVALELVSREAWRSFHGHTDCWRALALVQAEGAGERPAPEPPLS